MTDLSPTDRRASDQPWPASVLVTGGAGFIGANVVTGHPDRLDPGGLPAGSRILLVLTYYRPHVSGLTIYVERLAGELAARGHEVTVLTSQYDRSLPRKETIDGVRVVRVPVWARISKGVLMPMLIWSMRHARRADVVSIHLPQFDGAFVAAAGRLWRKPTVLTYHCDLRLPPGIVNRVADAVVFAMNYLAARLSHRIVAYTQDYADHSGLLRRFPRKIAVIPPPVIMPQPTSEQIEAFRSRAGLGSGPDAGPVIGSAARVATEKGVEFLVDAIPHLIERHPGLRVVFAGQYVDVVGESQYWAMLEPKIAALGDRWTFVGILSPDEMPGFYGSLDALVVSSVNSTESFGLVQVEAMLCGTPVVATDLPGVRQPVRMTGMGTVVAAGDAAALAAGIDIVLSDHDDIARPRAEIEQRFDITATVDAYEGLFAEIAAGVRG